MTRLENELAALCRTLGATEQSICRLERQIDAAQLAGLPSHELEATLRASRSLLGALFARREVLLDRIDREEAQPGTP